MTVIKWRGKKHLLDIGHSSSRAIGCTCDDQPQLAAISWDSECLYSEAAVLAAVACCLCPLECQRHERPCFESSFIEIVSSLYYRGLSAWRMKCNPKLHVNYLQVFLIAIWKSEQVHTRSSSTTHCFLPASLLSGAVGQTTCKATWASSWWSKTNPEWQ